MIRKNIKDSEWNNFPNFRKSEFVCPKFCNGYPSEIAYSLVEFMQKLRSHYNRAIHINSGLRCRDFNNELIGSDKESDHLIGLACDFNFENHVFTKLEKDEIMNYMRTLPNIKYCYTNQSNMYNGIHVSVYPTYEEKKATNDDLLTLVRKTIRGDFGNGEARKKALGDKYQEVQNQVNKNVKANHWSWDSIRIM